MDVGVICYGSSGGSSGDQVNDQILGRSWVVQFSTFDDDISFCIF